MKKSGLLFFVLFLVILFFNFLYAIEITGESIGNITGKTTSQQVALSIFIQSSTGLPYIEIISPKNNTYLKNYSILLNYLTNGESVWYNLDNTQNISVSSPIYLNVSQGFHVIYLFVNNSNGSASEKLNFEANSSKFIIYYEEYRGANKGVSTNFIDYTYEEIQGLSGIVLENTNYGKVVFNQPINMTDDRINADNILDLDSNIEISSNSIYLNSSDLTNFNKSATLYLYNLGFINPRILKDGVICPATVCVRESYSGSTLKFNVSQFSTYSAQETPVDEPIDDGGGGGGGSSSTAEKEVIADIIKVIKEISIDPLELSVSAKPGQTINKEIYVTNNHNESILVDISTQGLNNFVTVNESYFVLLPGETRIIKLNFTLENSVLPDSYLGYILVKTSKEVYQVVTVINVQSKESLFDVSLNINKTSPIFSGQYLLFKTKLYNVGDLQNLEAKLTYTLKNKNNKIFFEVEDIQEINAYYEKDGEIKLPKTILPGEYILIVKVEYQDKIAISSANFFVEKKKLPLIWKVVLPVIVILLALAILWEIGKKERRRKERRKE